MRKLLTAMVFSIALLGLYPGPASAAEAVLTVDDIVVDSSGGEAQYIRISGDTNQAITVEFPDGAPDFADEPFRYGQQPCAKETETRFVCGGTSDIVYVRYRPPLEMEESRSFTVVATADDGARATGTVSVQVLADVRVAENVTEWRASDSPSTSEPAKLIVAEQNQGRRWRMTWWSVYQASTRASGSPRAARYWAAASSSALGRISRSRRRSSSGAAWSSRSPTVRSIDP
jgi:hypothetical protein